MAPVEQPRPERETGTANNGGEKAIVVRTVDVPKWARDAMEKSINAAIARYKKSVS